MTTSAALCGTNADASSQKPGRAALLAASPCHRRRRRSHGRLGRRVAHFTTVNDVAHPDDNTKIYAVTGELFVASSNDLVYPCDYRDDPTNVVIDLTDSHIWGRLRCRHPRRHYHQTRPVRQTVQIVGLNNSSAEHHERPAGKLSADH